jgi:archaellin
MVSESINTAIIVIAGLIVASMVSAALLTQIAVLDSSMRIAVRSAQDRLQTSISIVLVSLNTTSIDSQTTKYFVIYIKNVGGRSISTQEIQKSDLYLQDSSITLYMLYSQDSKPGRWSYIEAISNGSWDVGETIIVKAYNSTSLIPPVSIRFVLPNGISSEYRYVG